MSEQPAPTPAELDPHTLLPLLGRYEEARAAIELWEAVKKQVRNEITALLGEAEEGRVGPDVLVRYRPIRRDRVDDKALRSRYPGIYDEVVVTSAHFQFNHYWKPGKT